MEIVDRYLLAQLAAPARVVCLATAAAHKGPQRVAYWSERGEEYFTRLGAEVSSPPVVDRASANDPQLAAQIEAANFVYLSGGRPDYLHRTLKGSLARQAILRVGEAGGVIAGCSAGAMILGDKFVSYTGWHSGFNLLPGVTVVPHFDRVPPTVRSAGRRLIPNRVTIIGIDSLTALVRNGSGEWSVLGEGSVTIWKEKAQKLKIEEQRLVFER